MKKFLLMTAAIAVSLILNSCSGVPTDESGKDPDPVENLGKVQLSMNTDSEFEVVQKTKSSSLDIDAGDLKVVIFNSQGTVIAQWAKYSEMPEFVELTEAKDYKIVAYNAELESVAFEAPYYYGEASFDIILDQITPVDVVASLGNIMLTMNVSQEFITYYGGDYRIIVRNDDYILPGDPELIFEPGETRNGFVKPSPFSVIIEAGSTIQTRVVEDVNAKEHHTFNVDVVAVGTGGFSITVDRSVTDKSEDLVVPGGTEDLGNGGTPKPDTDVVPPTPGDDDDDDDANVDTAPDVQLEGLNIDEVIVVSTAVDIVEGVCVKQLKANITAPKGIKNLIVTIDSPELSYDLLAAMFGDDNFDLANLTPELHAGLAQLGLITEDAVIKDQTAFSFEVGGFMSLLGENETYHKFHVEVIDNDNNSVKKTLSVSRTE